MNVLICVICIEAAESHYFWTGILEDSHDSTWKYEVRKIISQSAVFNKAHIHYHNKTYSHCCAKLHLHYLIRPHPHYYPSQATPTLLF